jgi:hypothetical protein
MWNPADRGQPHPSHSYDCPAGPLRHSRPSLCLVSSAAPRCWPSRPPHAPPRCRGSLRRERGGHDVGGLSAGEAARRAGGLLQALHAPQAPLPPRTQIRQACAQRRASSRRGRHHEGGLRQAARHVRALALAYAAPLPGTSAGRSEARPWVVRTARRVCACRGGEGEAGSGGRAAGSPAGRTERRCCSPAGCRTCAASRTSARGGRGGVSR